MIIGSGSSVKGFRFGYFVVDRWVCGEDVVYEFFVGGEGFF